MQTNLDQLALAWYEQTLPIPDLAAWAAPEFREIALQNARLDIGRELIGLAEGRSLPTECPPEIVVSAELAVNTGYPLWAALQAYRTGHAIQWKAWSDAVERRTNRREDRRLLLEAGSDYMFAYADRASRWVEIAYTRLRDQQLRSSEQRRIQLVRDILAGEDPEPRELGYELDRWHLGVIASGLEAEAIVRELALKTSADLLSLAADGSNSWMWLGFPTIAAGRGSLSTVHAPTDGGVALGDPAFGVAGFVETHQQAQRAAVIGGSFTDLSAHIAISLSRTLLARTTPARAPLSSGSCKAWPDTGREPKSCAQPCTLTLRPPRPHRPQPTSLGYMSGLSATACDRSRRSSEDQS